MYLNNQQKIPTQYCTIPTNWCIVCTEPKNLLYGFICVHYILVFFTGVEKLNDVSKTHVLSPRTSGASCGFIHMYMYLVHDYRYGLPD